MCGIFVSSSEIFSSSEKINIAKQSLANRGPDDCNYERFKNGLTLLHTRLAIQDESEAGKQPMFSNLSNNVIIYNGEIYNSKYLKSYLKKKYSFTPISNCDTEILLEGFSLEGKKFLEKIDGIYAFVMYNKVNGDFYVARDNLGIKPLLYSIVDKGILISSDVNTLFEILEHPLPSNKSIIDLLSLTFVPEPNTLFDEIKYFKPGFLFHISNLGEFKSIEKIESSIKSKTYKKNETFEKSLDTLHKLMGKSVHDQLIADSKVGLFLSSGIDSSLLLSILVEMRYELLLAITLTYPSIAMGTDSQESENLASKLVSKISELDHLEITPPLSLYNYDKILNYLVIEGISDPAALATFHLSNLAKKKGCKVMLAGQGADELFFGYRRHKIVSVYKFLKKIPKINTSILEKLLSLIKIPSLYSKFRKFIKLLKLCGNSPTEILVNLYTWVDKKSLNKLLVNPVDSTFTDEVKNNSLKTINHNIIELFDLKYDLQSLNLRYSDRLGMYSSIEIRVPYLSTELIKYAQSLPTNFKCRFLNTKYILKKLSKRLLPDFITKRSKTGFSLPLQSILKNDKKLVLEVFKKNNTLFNNFINKNEVDLLIKNFYEHKFNNSQLIFSLYILKKMFDKFYF